MSNAKRILSRLDEYLTSNVELTLFGRAAFQLGFGSPFPEYAASLDVDGVLWTGQAEELARSTNFWVAADRVNRELSAEHLFISHFFEETQVILSQEWKKNRVDLPGSLKHIHLMRLGDGDLFLTKLMRYDPQDLEDARFIVERAGFTRDDIRAWVGKARLPDIAEIREQFALCSQKFLKDIKAGDQIA